MPLKITCIGSVHLDIFIDTFENHVIDGRGSFVSGLGGTAFNIATGLLFAGCKPYFISVLKKSSLFTRLILYAMDKIGIDKNNLEMLDYISDAGFFALRNNNELIKAVNVTPIEQLYLKAKNYKKILDESDAICIDFNNSIATIEDFIFKSKKPVYCHCVSEEKSLKLLKLSEASKTLMEKKIKAIFLNRYELKYLLKNANQNSPLGILKTLWVVTKDKDGVMTFSPDGKITKYPNEVKGVTGSFSGAGDAFAAGFISAHIQGKTEYEYVQNGYRLVEVNLSKKHSGVIDESFLEEVDSMLFKDPLTGLYTRKFFLEEAKIIEARTQRSKKPFSVLLFDIDNFKKVNDMYGHDIGDLVLKQTGHIIATLIRASDIPVRLGGEELLVIFPETTIKKAHPIAERIRKAIKDHTFNLNGNGTLNVTVSGGIAEGITNIDEAIKKADEALYTAKRTGKDRICF